MNKKIFLAGLFTVFTVFAANAGCHTTHHNIGCGKGCHKHNCQCYHCPAPKPVPHIHHVCGGPVATGVHPMPKPAPHIGAVNGVNRPGVHPQPKPFGKPQSVVKPVVQPKPKNRVDAKPINNQAKPVNNVGAMKNHLRG